MRKGHTLTLILGGLAICYALMAVVVHRGSGIAERRLGAPPADGERQVRIYVEALGVDAADDAIRLRVSAAPGPALRGPRGGAPTVPLRVSVTTGDVRQDVAVAAGEAMTPLTLDADLQDGVVAAYPFDRYRVDLGVAAGAGGATDAGDGTPLPVAVTVWEGVAGWSLRAMQRAGDPAAAVPLRLDVRRTTAVRFLAASLYGVMVLIALSALTIGGTVFLRRRPADTSLISAFTGMAFTLPAVRYGLPGSPPLGVDADLFVFFWAEIGVTVALMLVIVSWMRDRAPA